MGAVRPPTTERRPCGGWTFCFARRLRGGHRRTRSGFPDKARWSEPRLAAGLCRRASPDANPMASSLCGPVLSIFGGCEARAAHRIAMRRATPRGRRGVRALPDRGCDWRVGCDSQPTCRGRFARGPGTRCSGRAGGGGIVRCHRQSFPAHPSVRRKECEIKMLAISSQDVLGISSHGRYRR